MSYKEVPDEEDFERKAMQERERLYLVTAFCFVIIMGCILAFTMTGCTISLQNISTHGNASDLGDEDFKTDAEVDPDLSVPLTGV